MRGAGFDACGLPMHGWPAACTHMWARRAHAGARIGAEGKGQSMPLAACRCRYVEDVANEVIKSKGKKGCHRCR